MLKRGIFYGWWIVLAASIINFWGAGMIFYSFTAFFNPLVQEFGWSYSATSFAASFRGLESGVAAPIVGFLCDRFGARKLMFIGSIVAGAGCMWLSRINSLWSFYLAFIFFSVGSSFTHPIPGWAAVNNWFSRKRATAMGILMASVGASGILIILVNWLIAQYGWRATFVIAGAGIWIIGLPLSLVIRQKPENYGYVPDGEEPPEKQPNIETRKEKERAVDGKDSGYSAWQAAKTRAFWLIAIPATISSAGLHAVSVHVMPSLISVQIPRDVASSIAASLIISSVAGRFGFGWLGDRISKTRLLAFSLLLQALGLVIFAYTSTVAYAIAFLALFGPGFGGVVTLRVAIQGDYYGRKAFASIQGLTMAIFLTGNIGSPLLAGWIYDIQGSYQLVWLVLAALIFVSIPMVLALKPPKQEAPSPVAL